MIVRAIRGSLSHRRGSFRFGDWSYTQIGKGCQQVSTGVDKEFFGDLLTRHDPL